MKIKLFNGTELDDSTFFLKNQRPKLVFLSYSFAYNKKISQFTLNLKFFILFFVAHIKLP